MGTLLLVPALVIPKGTNFRSRFKEIAEALSKCQPGLTNEVGLAVPQGSGHEVAKALEQRLVKSVFLLPSDQDRKFQSFVHAAAFSNEQGRLDSQRLSENRFHYEYEAEGSRYASSDDGTLCKGLGAWTVLPSTEISRRIREAQQELARLKGVEGLFQGAETLFKAWEPIQREMAVVLADRIDAAGEGISHLLISADFLPLLPPEKLARFDERVEL